MGGVGGVTAALTVLVRASGVGVVNKQLAGVQGQLTATGAKAGGMGALIRKGLMVGAAAIAGIGVALFKVGEEFDDAYDTIRVGTGATGKTLEGLKGDFKEVVKAVPTDFKTASTAIADLNTRLGLTGKPLQDRAKQFLELSRITKTDVGANIKDVTRAFGDWEVKTGDQASQLDKFFRAAQSSGATVGELAQKVVQFGAPLRQVGFSLDEATAMFANFEKAGVNVETMMPGIKQALGSFAESGIDPKKGLAKAFKDIESGAMSSEEAVKLFGKRAGTDMIEAVKQGRFKLDDMTKTLVNGRDTIMQAGKDTQDFSEKWQIFKNRVMVGLEPLATAVFGALGTAMDVLPGIAEKVIGAIRLLVDPLVAVAKAIADNKEVMIALSPIAVMLAAHLVRLAAVAAFGAVLRGLAGAFWALNAAMRANPIGMIITAISLLVAGLILAYKKSETFRAIVDGAFKGVKAAFGWVLDAAKNVFGWLKSNWPTILAILTGPIGLAVLAIVKNWDKIKSATSAVWRWIKGFVGGAATGAKNAAVGAFNSLKSRASAIWNGIKGGVSTAWNAIKDFVTGRARAIRDTAVRIFNSLKNGVATAFERVKSAVKSAFDTIWGFLKSLPARMYQAGRSLIIALANGIKAVAMAPVNAVKGVINRVRNLLPGSEPKDPSSPLRGLAVAGAAIMENMAAGVPTGAQALASAMTKHLAAVRTTLKPLSSYDKVGTLRGEKWNNPRALFRGRLEDETIFKGRYVPRDDLRTVSRGVAGSGAVNQSRSVQFVHNGDVVYSDSSDEDRVVRKQLWQLRVAGLA